MLSDSDILMSRK